VTKYVYSAGIVEPGDALDAGDARRSTFRRPRFTVLIGPVGG
jgi:hypothetical protein